MSMPMQLSKAWDLRRNIIFIFSMTCRSAAMSQLLADNVSNTTHACFAFEREGMAMICVLAFWLGGREFV